MPRCFPSLIIAGVCVLVMSSLGAAARPNILLAISDDQSWPHSSAYGDYMVSTPAFDRIAREGVLLTQAFCASPGCSPSRAALLTGRHTWQIEHAGTHASYFDKKYPVYPDLLEQDGYFVGYTGKGWGPGDWKTGGRTRNPAGPAFGGKGGYVAGFREFLEQRPGDQPFCFWFGSTDAHRPYAAGSGRKSGKTLEQATVPPFLPDTPEIRSDLLDYAFEVDRFDHDLQQMLDLIEQAGELDNTLVIVTSDNGMPFPRAKANCYEYGLHMPLAIRWGESIPAGRVIDDLIGFVDLTATIYDAAGVALPTTQPVSGHSLLPMLQSTASGVTDPSRDAVFAARERHSSSRYNSLGYPQRCIRTHDFLLIRNFTPELWPAGPPQALVKPVWTPSGELQTLQLGPEHSAYHDIDGCPTLDFLIQHRTEPAIGRFLQLAVEHRPAIELFAIRDDPGCLRNLADDPAHVDTRRTLENRLNDYLTKTDDARLTENGDVWETYPRVSSLRWFPEPDWAREQPDRKPRQDWLESRRPRK